MLLPRSLRSPPSSLLIASHVLRPSPLLRCHRHILPHVVVLILARQGKKAQKTSLTDINKTEGVIERKQRESHIVPGLWRSKRSEMSWKKCRISYLRLDDVVLHQDVIGQLGLAQIEQRIFALSVLLRSAPPCCCLVFEVPVGVY